MKIVKEDSHLLVLKDHNLSHYMGALLCIVVGFIVAYVFFSTNLLGVVIGGFFFLFGIVLLFITKRITLRLDKMSRKFFYHKQGLISKEVEEHHFDQIKEIRLDQFRKSNRNSAGYQYILMFVLKDREIPVEFGHVSISLLGEFIGNPSKKLQENAKKIADFIGVPYNFTGAPGVGEFIKTGFSFVQDQIDKHNKKNE